MPTLEATAQRRQALQSANRTRLDGCQVRAAIRAGHLTAGDALSDPRAGSLAMWRLLSSIPAWGTVKTERFCRAHRVSPGRRVRELTVRERLEITEALDGR